MFDTTIEKWLLSLNSELILKEAADCVSKALSCGFDGLVVQKGIITCILTSIDYTRDN
jgi:hypothetical protein